MPTALLFRVSRFSNGPPEWLVCDESAVREYAYPAGPWFQLGSQSEIEAQRTADIEDVRRSDEFRWTPRPRWRKRIKRHGSNAE